MVLSSELASFHINGDPPCFYIENACDRYLLGDS